MGKQSKRKSRKRGAAGPRPLGFTGESPALDALTRAHIQTAEEAAGHNLHRGLEQLSVQGTWTSDVIDCMIEGACCDEDSMDYLEESEDDIPLVKVEKLKEVLRKAKATPENYSPSTDCIWSCARNDFGGAGLELLLRDYGGIANCNQRHSVNQSTPISICCSRGNLAGLKTMIRVAKDLNFDLNAGKVGGLTGAQPLFWALQSRGNNHALGSVRDFCKIVSLLVTELGQDIDCVQVNHTSPPTTGLVRSCELGELHLVETCLDLGADVNRPSKHNMGGTPLHFAVKSGKVSITELLLQKGADTRIECDGNLLPIKYSLLSMNFACADAILRHEQELGDALPPYSPEQELYNNLTLIQEFVANFRNTGKVSGDMESTMRVCDLRSNRQEIQYNEQVTTRTLQKDSSKSQQCASCGTYGAGLKRCSLCRHVYYCNRECQKSHWKEHKKDCRQGN